MCLQKVHVEIRVIFSQGLEIGISLEHRGLLVSLDVDVVHVERWERDRGAKLVDSMADVGIYMLA